MALLPKLNTNFNDIDAMRDTIIQKAVFHYGEFVRADLEKYLTSLQGRADIV